MFVVPTSAWVLHLYVRFYGVMSVSGGAATDAGADPGVSELDENIVDVVASLRGAASAGLLVARYDRYVGCTDFVEGDLVVEAPEWTVGTAVQSYKLDAAVVDGGEWSIFPRTDFTWGELVALRRWDVRKVGIVGLARLQCVEEVLRCFLQRSRCRFQIPADLRCDRTFLEEARDGLYVKAMQMWLFEGGESLPMLECDAMRKVVVDERGQLEGKASLLMFMGAGRVISFPDYACFRGMDSHEMDVRFCGKFEESTTMVVPFYDFPVVPPVVAGVVPPLIIAVRLPRVAYYFGQTEKSQEPAVRKRYERALGVGYRGFVGTGHRNISSLLDLRLGVYRVSAEFYRFSLFLCGLRVPFGDSRFVQIVGGRAAEDSCVVVGVRELPYGLCHAQEKSVCDEEFGDAGAH